MKKNDFKCPDCDCSVSVWADLDAMVTFKVGKNGKLISKGIENTHQTDGRSGVKCTICDWEILGDDLAEYPHFESLAEEAFDYQDRIILLAIKSKSQN